MREKRSNGQIIFSTITQEEKPVPLLYSFIMFLVVSSCILLYLLHTGASLNITKEIFDIFDTLR